MIFTGKGGHNCYDQPGHNSYDFYWKIVKKVRIFFKIFLNIGHNYYDRSGHNCYDLYSKMTKNVTSILIDGDDVTVLIMKGNKSDVNFNIIFFTSTKNEINPFF